MALVRLDRVSLEGSRRGLLRVDLCTWCGILRALESLRETLPVLVRKKSGSAKRVMFLTLENETEVANLIVWPSLFERQCREILPAGMLGCQARVQRQGKVISLIAEHLIDLSDLLRSVGERKESVLLPAWAQAVGHLICQLRRKVGVEESGLTTTREPCRILQRATRAADATKVAL
jgi:DNA polymerase III alpha subunit